MPTLRRILSMSTSGSVASKPPTWMVPSLGCSSRFTQRSRVDLPEPEGPIRQTTSPGATSRLMPLSTSLEP